ncbi:hypothetical protein EAX61_11645 [Dokdonia sinensis]|uniref:DUF5723 domain-containing protein n=1 Tax=Dokdonia sinensis TaxID=2479847 RepID=A0A3M0G6K1_9FLAO|nr:DUF5723 family protein [Dokdonia sinensis]RMB57393.1 hypothetical protein EAX61_11645 [Dokdonia sinensis]
MNLKLLFLSLICAATLQAQSFKGLGSSNYAGIHGAIYNPAQIAASPYTFDFNLVSVYATAGSDYFGIDLGSITDQSEGFDFEDASKQFPKDDNNFFLNTDVVGPSFMFNLSPKSSIGIITRARGMFNLNNISGELYEDISDNFDEDEDFEANSENFSGTVHAWAEIGLTYGYVVSKSDNHALKVGATVKYLQGAGSLFLASDSIDAVHDASETSLTSTGDLSYGTTVDFDNDDISFDNLTSGFGLDIGFVYESKKDSLSTDKGWKIGVSINDIGNINYKDTETTVYNLNQTVDTAIFDDEDLEQVLEDNYDGQTSVGATKVGLPTSAHIFADYNIHKRLYIGLESSISLVNRDKTNANRIYSYATLNPRLEMKWLAVYSPITVQQYTGLSWGAGVKLGPLTIGSGSILTNLLSDSSKATDVYVGLKVPFFKRS